MGKPSQDTYRIFIGVAIALLSVILVTLPGLAGTPDESISTPTTTGSSKAIWIGLQDSDTPLATPSPTLLITQAIVISATELTTPTLIASPTYQSTATPTPTILLAPAINQPLFLPLVYQQQITPTPTNPPPYILERVLFCDSLPEPLAIPDNSPNGVNNDILINDGRLLVNVRLYLDVTHTWVGDLVVKLSHQTTGQSITVLNRPGTAPYYCSNNNIGTILDDNAARPADEQCATYPLAISGIYLPTQSFANYSGEGIDGTWRLNISDNYQNDVGTLNHWCLQATVAETMPIPTPPPTPVSLPSSASVTGMSGQDQQLKLDCESRSAVDWARHFAVNIDELGFLNNLPVSDDPEAGFVGNPNGVWGNIPPNDYGVHAAPVAALLRQYGLTASSYHSLLWDDLRAEIAAGHPAIIWIVGGGNYSLVNGIPHFYTAASTDRTTVVAPYEHTVIVVGYTPDTVTVLNGARFVTLPLDQFLDSWSALDFMAVLARP